MPVELTVLAYAALLQVVQFALMAVPLNLQLGVRYTAGPRDRTPEISGNGARLKRAFDNHFEALILFTIAVVVVTMGDQSSAITRTCAWIYLVARIAYIPAYVMAIWAWRSVIYFIGLLATVFMILAALW